MFGQDKKSLEGLKAGDEVALFFSGYGSNGYRLAKVSKITPSGRIKTDDGTEFNANGVERGGGYNGYILTPMTDEIRAKIADDAERSRLNAAIYNWSSRRSWKDVSTVGLRRIVSMIEEIEAERKGGE